jgi:hypothetical protein
MSFFEITGLVLAIVPLILEGFKAYPNAVPVNFWRALFNAKIKRRNFAIKLEHIHTELRFAVISILMRINASFTPEQQEVLTANNRIGADFFNVWNEIWKINSEEVEFKFTHIIENIKDIPQHMADLLNEMLKHTEISACTSKETLRKIIKHHEQDKTFTITNFSKRFMFAASDSKRHKLIKRMEEDIELLKKLNKGQRTVEKFIAHAKLMEPQESHVSFLKKVQNYCEILHNSLSKIWQCRCHKCPSALLRLEYRKAPESKECSSIQFSLFLTFKFSVESEEIWDYQETEISIDQTYIYSLCL